MAGPQVDPPEHDDDRARNNLVLLIGFVILVGAGIWLVNALLDARQADECMSSGRRNCNPVNVTPLR